MHRPPPPEGSRDRSSFGGLSVVQVDAALFAGDDVSSCPLDADVAAELRRLMRVDPQRGDAACDAAFAIVMARHLKTNEVRFRRGPTTRIVKLRDDTTVYDLVTALRQQARGKQPASDVAGTSGLTSWPPSPGETFAQLFRDARLDVDVEVTPPVGRDLAPSSAEDGLAPAPAWSARVIVDLGHERLTLVHPGLGKPAAARTLASFAHVLGCVVDAGGALVGEVQVLPADERRRIIETWNARDPVAASLTPAFEPLQAAFERQAKLRPDAVALEADGHELTYRELDKRANQLAHALHLRGAGPGTVVGVCMERSANLVVALMGVLKTGAAYLPLDPSFPRERIARMLKVAHATLAVTEVHLHHLVGNLRGVILQHGINRSLVDLPNDRPPATAVPSDPCYVMFTSGSTGEPKGVVVSHRAAVSTLRWVNERCGVGPCDRALFVTSPSFDLSVYDLFGVLGAGGTVVVASTALRDDPQALARSLVERRITLWNSAPAAFEQILPFVASASTSPTSPSAERSPALRWVLLSGDWIPLSLPAALKAHFPEASLLALGGATEAAIWSNAFLVEELDPAWKSIPYGRPIAGMRYHILDERRHPVPVGVPGELYIGGMGLAEGYVNRPSLTSERFVPDPFHPAERLYRTGDGARYFEDGNIELLGRLDRQTKIRGFRVECAEIEAALLASVSVRHAVCVAHPDGSGQQALTAYVVPWPDTPVSRDGMRRTLARTLPAYMVPDEIVFCERLPLTAQGKIDRQALPRPQEHLSGEIVAPRNAREAEMQTLWQELLGRPRIGIRDTFASCGGHSLAAVKLVTALKARWGREVPLSSLVAHPTIESLVAHLFPGEVREGASQAPRESSAARQAPVSARRAPHLFVLQEGSTRPPLVLVAGVGGYAFTYRNFPQFFGPDQPIYAFQSLGAEPSEPLEDLSIEQIAAVYERELEVLPDDGPIILGGFSFGALPAFELACRLQRRGRRVPLLVSLDGFAPGYPAKKPLAVRLFDHVTRLAEASPEERRDYLDARWGKVKERAFRALGREAALAPDLPFDDALNARLKDLWVMHRKAARAYRPKDLALGRLLLLRVEEPEHWPGTAMDDPCYGWERHITGPVSLATIPARHTELLTSAAHQKTCADHITRHIDAVVSAEHLNGRPPRPTSLHREVEGDAPSTTKGHVDAEP